jgi:cysteine desulfurase
MGATGNAGSPNASGERAARIIADSRAEVAELIGAAASEIIFTSGATEANNIALLGVAQRAHAALPGRRRIIVTAVEHKAVLEPARILSEQGFTLDIAPVDANGRLDLNAFAGLMDKDLLLASIMLVNNETGGIQPVADAAAMVHKAGGLIHSDAAQAAGKIEVNAIDLDIDYLSLSAHKCMARWGLVRFVAANAPKPMPIVYGGGQQGTMRPGTEPVALIAGLALRLRLRAHRSMLIANMRTP